MDQDELARLQALLSYGVLDTEAEERFDRITQLAADLFQAPMACVSLIDGNRQWFKSRIGIEAAEMPRTEAFCDHAIRGAHRSVMVVDDATQDPRFANFPSVTGDTGIRFYAGAVLSTSEGANLGTLCVIDTDRRPGCSPAERQRLRALADMVMDQIELSRAKSRLDERSRLLDLAENLSQTGNWSFRLDSSEVNWSRQVYTIHGVDPETFDPSLNDALAFYVDEDRRRITEIIRSHTAKGEGWQFDATIVRADGSRRSVRSVSECQRDPSGRVTGFFGVFKDLTDERQSVERALEQERRYRLLADNISDVIAVYDAKGVFSYVSPAIRDLVGYGPEELIGQTPQSFILPEDHAKLRDAFSAAFENDEPLTVEYRVRTADGRIRWLEARPRFHKDEEGKLVEIHDCVRDVTRRHEREEALAKAQIAAEQAGRAKAAFLANMSHEIRTPLNGVIGFAEVLAKTDLTADQARYVDRIRTAGRGLSALVDDILDLSKMDAGKMTIERRPFDLRALCEEIVDLTRSAVGDRLAFAINYDPSLGSMVLGDEQRVRQILMNLMGNAAKFTQHGAVTLAAARQGDRVDLRVSDTGVGIAPEALDRLFDEFAQADDTVSRRFGGSGLGLTISRSLARLMDGDVHLASVEGKGTTATLALPFLPATISAPEGHEPAPPTPLGAPRSLQVLAVDDVALNLELLGIMLADAGHVVTMATSGQEAISHLAEGQRFDLILMDVQMPEMDGLEASRRIRAQITDPPPIIALSANVLPEQIQACRDAGMVDHLAKPLRPEALGAAIGTILETRLPTDLEAAMVDLRRRYELELRALERDFREMRALEMDERRGAIAGLAHTVAGTSGSFGFDSVSRAAFALEAAALDGLDVDTALEALVTEISRAIAG